MSLMICEVPSAEARIDSIAPAICCMASAPSAATPFADWASELACCALSADDFTMLAIDSSEEEVSSSELACSEAPEATCWLVDAISAAAEETWPTEVDTCPRASCSSWAVALSAVWSRAYSPGKAPAMRAVRSRWASCSSAAVAPRTGARNTSSRVPIVSSSRPL